VRDSFVQQRFAETLSNARIAVSDFDRHALAKKPKIDPEELNSDSSQSPTDSPSPRRFDDTDGVRLANHFT